MPSQTDKSLPWEFLANPVTPSEPPYNFLNTLMGAALEKPRGRSEREARFTNWQKPASQTEEQKIDRVDKRIRTALARSNFLPTRGWTIIKQGSYHNLPGLGALRVDAHDGAFGRGLGRFALADVDIVRAAIESIDDQVRKRQEFCVRTI